MNSKKSKYFSFSKSYIGHNEDSCFACKNWGFVIDGATGLSGEHYTHYHSDAQWLAKKVSKYLKKYLSENNSIKDIVKNCIVFTTKQYDNVVKGRKIYDRPSCCLSLFRVENDKISLFNIGDCTILIKYINGNIEKIKKKDLCKIEKNSHEAVIKYKKEHDTTYLQAKKSVKTVFLKNRMLKNTPEGYYIFCDDVSAVEHAILKTIDKNDVDKIIIVSDGFSQYFDTFKFCDYQSFFDLLKSKKDAKQLYNHLLESQLLDNECENFNRFKVSDDASLIYWENNI